MATNAPGKHCRQGSTVVGLVRRFPNHATTEAWFASLRWPDSPDHQPAQAELDEPIVAVPPDTTRGVLARALLTYRPSRPLTGRISPTNIPITPAMANPAGLFPTDIVPEA